MIELKDVSAGYGKEDVIKNVTIDFPKGLTVIIGPNGSGKSTLVKTAMGLTDWSGLITYDGRNIADLSLKERAIEAGILLQDHVSPDLSVRRLVRHGRYSRTEWPRKYNQVDEEVTNRALKTAGINGLASRKVCELSGGQRQRAYLALLLCQQPETYFFDEPNAALDLESQLELQELMVRLAKDHPVVTVIHDLGMALKIADRVVLMDEGRIKFIGTPQQLEKTHLIEQVFHVSMKKAVIDGQPEYCFRKAV